MKFSTSFTAALLSTLSITAAATPTPAGEVVEIDLSGFDLSNVDISNATAVLAATGLSKRQNYEWFVLHYTGRDCSESWINAWGGSGASGCIAIPDGKTSRSRNFIRNSGNRAVRVTGNNFCGTPASVDGRTGCQSYPANINQFGAASFEVQ